MDKNYILDNKVEKEFNKYLFEIEKGKFIHVKELLSEFEHSQNLLEDLAKQLEEKGKEIDRLNDVIKGLREERDYLFNKTKIESKVEIDRLNNIINELERYINNMVYETPSEEENLNCILNKLKELKGE